MQEGWTLEMDPSIKDPDWVVQRFHALRINEKFRLLRKIVAIDSVNIVSAVWSPSWATQALINVGFASKIPSVSVRINHTGCCDTNVRIDIVAVAEIRLEEWSSQVSRHHDNSSLRIDLVDIALGGSNEKILNAVA
jgi:hypothetical protein